jgi:hypothetical protein
MGRRWACAFRAPFIGDSDMRKSTLISAGLYALASASLILIAGATPAAADITNPYGPGYGFVKCPDGTTRPHIMEPGVAPNHPDYNAINARNAARAAAAFLTCNQPVGPGGFDPAISANTAGPADIKNVEAITAVDPVEPSTGPSMATLPCCERPGQQTELNLSTGTGAWTVKLPASATDGPTSNAANVAWTTAVLTASNWISPNGNPTGAGNYIYSTKFDAGECRVRCTIAVSGRFLVDNRGVLKVDGVTVATSVGTPNYGFLPGSVTPFTYNIPVVSGVHTVTFEAYNQSGPTGANIELQVRRRCMGRPVGPGGPRNGGPAGGGSVPNPK